MWLASAGTRSRRARAAAKALGMSLADVVLYPVAAGGSFDRRLEHDHAIEVALIAREAAGAGATGVVALAGTSRRPARVRRSPG